MESVQLHSIAIGWHCYDRRLRALDAWVELAHWIRRVSLTRFYVLVLHTGVALWHRMWWILPTIVLCGILEVLGWAGRLWSYYEPWLGSPFEMQYVLELVVLL